MTKKATNKAQELQARVQELESLLPPMVVAVVFGPDGQVLNVTGTDLVEEAALRAARSAVRVTLNFVDDRLLEVVAGKGLSAQAGAEKEV